MSIESKNSLFKQEKSNYLNEVSSINNLFLEEVRIKAALHSLEFKDSFFGDM